MDSAGVRALAESAKSYFASNTDVEELTEYLGTTIGMVQENQDSIRDINYAMNLAVVQSAAARPGVGMLIEAASSKNYSYISSSNSVMPPPVPTSCTSFSCKGNIGLHYFPTMYLHSVSSLASAFYGCTHLQYVGDIMAPKCTVIESAFFGCTALRKVGYFSAPLATTATSMFEGCSELRKIDGLDLGPATNTARMFFGCLSLSVIPAFDTSGVTNMNQMFIQCIATRIEGISLKSLQNATSMFGAHMARSLRYAIIKDIGATDVVPNFSSLPIWGADGEENLASLKYSLIHASYDRAANSKNPLAMQLGGAIRSRLTNADIAQITAKGFTIAS